MRLGKKSIKYILFFIVLNIVFAVFSTWYETLIFSSFIFYFVYFIEEFDKKILILEFSGLIGILQLLVAPMLYYYHGAEHYLFEASKMKQTPEVYFQYAVPGMLFYSFGILIFNYSNGKYYAKIIDRVHSFLQRNPSLPYRLLFLGIIATFVRGYLPESLQLFFLFITYFTSISCLYLLIKYQRSKSVKEFWILVMYIGWQILSSFRNAMFGEFIFIFICCFLLIAPSMKFKLSVKLATMIIAFTLLGFIQIAKPIIRMYTWGDNNKGGWSKAYQTITSSETMSSEFLISDVVKAAFVARANQGALVSNLMEHTPRKEPYANGETIVNSIVGVFIPRLIWSNKPKSGQKLFEQYVGINLGSFVSMGISPLGEMYANFGDLGKYAMLFLAIFLVLIFRQLLRHSINSPHLFLWIPFLLNHTIKVETDLTRTIGFLLKAILIMLIIKVLFRHVLKIKL